MNAMFPVCMNRAHVSWLIALKHHTSKLSTTDFNSTALSSISTFGFRGEALSSLCALCASVSVTTATTNEAPKGAILELNRLGKVENKGMVARQVSIICYIRIATSYMLPSVEQRSR